MVLEPRKVFAKHQDGSYRTWADFNKSVARCEHKQRNARRITQRFRLNPDFPVNQFATDLSDSEPLLEDWTDQTREFEEASAPARSKAAMRATFGLPTEDFMPNPIAQSSDLGRMAG